VKIASVPDDFKLTLTWNGKDYSLHVTRMSVRILHDRLPEVEIVGIGVYADLAERTAATSSDYDTEQIGETGLDEIIRRLRGRRQNT